MPLAAALHLLVMAVAGAIIGHGGGHDDDIGLARAAQHRARISSLVRTGTQSTLSGIVKSVGPLTRITCAPRRAAASASA